MAFGWPWAAARGVQWHSCEHTWLPATTSSSRSISVALEFIDQIEVEAAGMHAAFDHVVLADRPDAVVARFRSRRTQLNAGDVQHPQATLQTTRSSPRSTLNAGSLVQGPGPQPAARRTWHRRVAMSPTSMGLPLRLAARGAPLADPYRSAAPNDVVSRLQGPPYRRVVGQRPTPRVPDSPSV
jgi:hypothetical protein